MSEEEVGVTNAEMETPTADDAPAAVEETPVESTGEEAPKDNRNWEAYARKLESENKSFKQMYKERPAETVEESTQTPEQVEALQLLRQVVDEAIAPIRSQYEEQKEEQVLSEFSKDKYVQILGPEVNQELDKLPKYLQSAPLQDRLDYARAQAIAKNADKIAEINKQLGVEQAYNNQALKKAQSGPEPSRNKAGTERENLWDRFISGQLTREEIYENKAELDRLEKESLGIS